MQKYNLQLLQDKVCIITGAATIGSIGYATAELFAIHGAKIVLLDKNMNEQIAIELTKNIEKETDLKPDLLCLQCDITDFAACENVIATVLSHFSTIDSLVNCAGIVKSGGMLSITDMEYQTVMDVNLKGTFNICKAVLQVFSSKTGGTIVNLSSLAAQRGGGLVGGTHYAASKGGVLSLTKSIAREFAPKGIRANAICPAMIETPMLDGLTTTQLENVIAGIPLGRLGKPLELAQTCLFLASSQSGFITGATLDVNGGIHIH